MEAPVAQHLAIQPGECGQDPPIHLGARRGSRRCKGCGGAAVRSVRGTVASVLHRAATVLDPNDCQHQCRQQRTQAPLAISQLHLGETAEVVQTQPGPSANAIGKQPASPRLPDRRLLDAPQQPLLSTDRPAAAAFHHPDHDFRPPVDIQPRKPKQGKKTPENPESPESSVPARAKEPAHEPGTGTSSEPGVGLSPDSPFAAKQAARPTAGSSPHKSFGFALGPFSDLSLTPISPPRLRSTRLRRYQRSDAPSPEAPAREPIDLVNDGSLGTSATWGSSTSATIWGSIGSR